jgi:hypothetical protein
MRRCILSPKNLSRIAVGGLALLTLGTLLAQPGRARAQEFTISPYTGTEIVTFELQGSGWPAGSTPTLYWHGPDGTLRGQQAVPVAADGTFQLSVVPATDLLAPRTGHWVAEVCLTQSGADDCEDYDFIVE